MNSIETFGSSSILITCEVATFFEISTAVGLMFREYLLMNFGIKGEKGGRKERRGN